MQTVAGHGLPTRLAAEGMRALRALRAVIRVLLVVVVVASGLLVAGFASLYGAHTHLERPAAAAIVFTGAHERIEAGLDLLVRGAAKQLFISGANPGAGVWIAKFPQQFGLSRPDLQDLIACCVEFGELAEDTIQNGLEAACWLSRRGSGGPVLLVTSASHMPRAMAALRRQTRAAIHPFSVPDAAGEPHQLRRLTAEFLKYAATVVALRLPDQK